MPTDHENDARLKREAEAREPAKKVPVPPNKPAPPATMPEQSELFI